MLVGDGPVIGFSLLSSSLATNAYVVVVVRPVTLIINDLKPGYSISEAINFSGRVY